MLRKLVVGIAAAASLGAIALAPTAASAGWKGGWGGFGHHHHFHGYYGPAFGVGYVGAYDDGCYVTRRIMTPYGYRLRTVNVCY
ncbi:MAG TPA: hypothetical protein VGM35_07415 [Xanthobacteraceae bacterium]|jgi:hypothetical protein